MVPAGAGGWRFFRRPTIFPSFVRRIDFSLVLFSLFLIILRGCYNCSPRFRRYIEEIFYIYTYIFCLSEKTKLTLVDENC